MATLSKGVNIGSMMTSATTALPGSAATANGVGSCGSSPTGEALIASPHGAAFITPALTVREYSAAIRAARPAARALSMSNKVRLANRCVA